MRLLALLFVFCCPVTLLAARHCYTPEQALAHMNKDVCIKAHVYNVVELPDGTRFLDVCSPQTSDQDCRFSIVSSNADRQDVGDLQQYRGQDIKIRGTVRPFAGRAEIELSQARQFHGGAEKFRPNPALLRAFGADNGRPAVNDPALRSGHHRSIFKTRH